MNDYYRKHETKDAHGRVLYVEYDPVDVELLVARAVITAKKPLWTAIVVLGAIASFLAIMVCVL